MLVKVLILSLSIFSMLALGLGIKKEEFKFKENFNYILLAKVINFFLIPSFATLLIKFFQIEKIFAEGLFLCASCSAGASTGLFLLRSNANLTLGGILSISLSFFNSIFSPLLLYLYLGMNYNLELIFFLKLFSSTLVVQIFPILLGFYLQKIFRDNKIFFSKLFERISKTSLFFAILILGYENFFEIINTNIKVFISAILVILFSSYSIFLFKKIDSKTRNSISSTAMIRSLSLALLLAEIANINKLSILIYGLFMFILAYMISKWIKVEY